MLSILPFFERGGNRVQFTYFLRNCDVIVFCIGGRKLFVFGGDRTRAL